MKTIHVVAAIFIKEDTIFCCQRKDKGPLALKWEFPGGKIEEGETKEEALIREIKEELNTEIIVGDFYTSVNHQYESFHLIMDTYLCEVISGQFELNEHVDAKWMSKKDLKQLDWAEADYPIVEKLMKE